MNKQIITLLVAVLYSVITFANSTEPTIIVSDDKSFTIDNKVWRTETVEIEIADNFGSIIYSDEQPIKKLRKYNLENIPSGRYTITISNEIKSVVQNIEITKDGLLLDFDAETIYAPQINIENDKIDINFLSNGKNTAIKIYNAWNEVYSEVNKKTLSINKRLNIENLPTGVYTVTIHNANKTYSKSFTK